MDGLGWNKDSSLERQVVDEFDPNSISTSAVGFEG